MDITLTAAQVVEFAKQRGIAADLQPRTLQYWTAEGVVEPIDPTATRHRRYAVAEAWIARACACLYDLRIDARSMKPVADTLRRIIRSKQSSNRPNPWSSAHERLERARLGQAPAYFIFDARLLADASAAPLKGWEVVDDLATEHQQSHAMVVLDWRLLMAGT